MKSRDFVFWLQGFFELGGGTNGLSCDQVAMIKQHLGLVFKHDTDIAAQPHSVIPNQLPLIPSYPQYPYYQNITGAARPVGVGEAIMIC